MGELLMVLVLLMGVFQGAPMFVFHLCLSRLPLLLLLWVWSESEMRENAELERLTSAAVAGLRSVAAVEGTQGMGEVEEEELVVVVANPPMTATSMFLATRSAWVMKD